jgi:hypothetical protein
LRSITLITNGVYLCGFSVDQVELHAGIHRNDLMVRSAAMSEADRNDLSRRAAATGKDSFIVECAFDAARGQWGIKGYRMDKTEANFITTVIATMETIAENITREQLIEKCGGKPLPTARPSTSSSSSSSSSSGRH